MEGGFEFLDRLIRENFSGVDLEAQRRQAAERLGLDPEEVDVRKDVLVTNLCREGVLVDVHIGRTRFTRRLEEEDLGISPEDGEVREFFAEYVRLGEKYLLSLDYLRRLDKIESRARRAVERHGFRTRWGIFVPYGAWEEMKAEVEPLRAEYFAVCEEILAKYDALRAEVEEAYRAAARQAYRQMVMDRAAEPPEDFIRNFVGAVMKHFPTPEQIRGSFYFELDIGFVPLTSMLEEEEARRRLVEEKRRLVEEAVEAERAVIREQERTRIMEQRYKQDRIREIHREVLESYRRGLDDFLGSVLGRIRGMIYEACAAAKENVDRTGRLGPGDVRRLKTLVERVERLNFLNDGEVERYLSELRGILDVPAEARDPAEVAELLGEIAGECRQVLALLGCEARMVRGCEADSQVELEADREPARKPRPAVRQVAIAFDGDLPVRRRRAAL
ncbi:MAG: DUF3150 domain-containing protein [Moorellales bacterium]